MKQGPSLPARLAAGQGVLLAQALLVGAAGGAAAAFLRFAATALPQLVWPAAPDMMDAVALSSPAWRIGIPVAGALIAGLMLELGQRWAGTARGWDILEAVILRNGVLPVRPAIIKSASSLVTVASAGAVGREGPIVLLSATVASWLGQRFDLSTKRLRILVGCGIASGLACAYNAPLGAALFTLEVVFGTVTLEWFAPLALASATSTLITWFALGREAVFDVPSLAMHSPWESLGYAALGILGGLVAVAFLRALAASARLYHWLRLPRPIAMASAALVLGVAVLRYPELVGNGRSAIVALFHHPLSLDAVLALLVLRLIVTPLAVGSGTVGGVFTPTLFLGAMLGEAMGTIVAAAWPGLGVEPGAFALAGMGATLAGTTHAPLMAVVLVFEMTLDYGAVVPLLLACTLASFVATRLSAESVYTEALRRKASTGPGEGPAAIEALRVADLVRHDQVTISPDLTVPQLLDAFVAARRNNLYLVDGGGRFEGVVNLHDVNGVLRGSNPAERIIARDLVVTGFPTTTPDESLGHVLEHFEWQQCERLPVLESGSRRLLGTISKRDILAVYSLELVQRASRPRPVTPLDANVEGLVDEVEVPESAALQELDEARFRERYGLAVLMVRRADAGFVIPVAGLSLKPGDRLIVFGPRPQVAAFKAGIGRGDEARGQWAAAPAATGAAASTGPEERR